MANAKTVPESSDALRRFKALVDVDSRTLNDLLGRPDAERDDPFLTPWRRGCHAAIRNAYGD